MPRTILASTTLLVLLASAASAQSPERTLSDAASEYLEAALDTIEAVTMGRDTIPWAAVRDSARLLAWGAREPSDTWGAIQWALRRANRHSFLQAPSPGAVAKRVGSDVGYVRVPQRGGTAVPLADSLHSGVRVLRDRGVCGWIVDLRGNGGGNMWPMLAGIGPLLGDSIVGAFGSEESAQRWYYGGGVSGLLSVDGTIDTLTRLTVEPVPPIEPRTPVAVLVDRGTGSSGEAVAVAFRGRSSVRFFGERTAGYATVNRGARLPDGTNMVVTTGYYTDRTGRQAGASLAPDTVVAAGPTGWPYATDRGATAAAAWVRRSPACNDDQPQSRPGAQPDDV